MQIGNVNNNPEPQKDKIVKENEQEPQKYYSIFDNAPQDGTVSTEEQKTVFLNDVNKNSDLITVCKHLKINFLDFFKNFAGHLPEVKTDGTKESAENADRVVDLRIKSFEIKFQNAVIDKAQGKEKQPPSIHVQDGVFSEECISYIIGKMIDMGLEYDSDILFKILDGYDYDLSGEDSIISPNELYNVSDNSQFMEHDFDGNIKDTHALDYLVNKYAAVLKNKQQEE